MSRSWKARRASATWQVQVFDRQRNRWQTVMENYRSMAAAMRKARRLRNSFQVRVTDQRGKEVAHWVEGQRQAAPCSGRRDCAGCRSRGEIFTCKACQRPTPWCMGADDAYPDWCDPCVASAEKGREASL